jgi:hypothetical protein
MLKLVFYQAQESKRPFVIRSGPDFSVKAWYSFHVMVVYFRPGAGDRAYRVPVPFEIGGQHFNGVPVFLKEFDTSRKDAGASVGKVVARNGRDNNVAKFHSGCSFCKSLRFILGDWFRRTIFDIAEAAVPRADTAENHKRGSVARKAFTDIRAFCAVAYGGKPEFIENFLRGADACAVRDRAAKPSGETRFFLINRHP